MLSSHHTRTHDGHCAGETTENLEAFPRFCFTFVCMVECLRGLGFRVWGASGCKEPKVHELTACTTLKGMYTNTYTRTCTSTHTDTPARLNLHLHLPLNRRVDIHLHCTHTDIYTCFYCTYYTYLPIYRQADKQTAVHYKTLQYIAPVDTFTCRIT